MSRHERLRRLVEDENLGDYKPANRDEWLDAISAAALADHEAEAWKPASEPPKECHTVLVDGGIAYFRDGAWYSLTAMDYPGKVIQWKVTHWRELPTPPEVKS